MKILRPLALGTLVAATLAAIGCDQKATPAGPAKPTVTAANPKSTDVTNFIEFTGTVGAFQSVNVVARVEGYLEEISFKDGSYVTKGTPLFKIQQAQYLDQLKIDQAQLAYNQAEYERQTSMFKQNATSKANVQKYQSDMLESEANVALAQLNLDYTTLSAPFDGLVGEHQVDIGNVVGNNPADPTVLVTIERIIPVYVNFSVNTRDALRLRRLMQEHGMDPKSGVGKIPIFARLEDETDFPYEGVLDFSNNSVDTSTGTIQLRGIFPNQDRALFPGLFAALRMPLGPPTPGLVVPETSLLSDQQGDYVLVLDDHDAVQRRSVVKGPLNGSARAISDGLTSTDRVIIDGIANVSIGQTVTVTTEAADSTPTPAPTPSPTP